MAWLCGNCDTTNDDTFLICDVCDEPQAWERARLKTLLHRLETAGFLSPSLEVQHEALWRIESNPKSFGHAWIQLLAPLRQQLGIAILTALRNRRPLEAAEWYLLAGNLLVPIRPSFSSEQGMLSAEEYETLASLRSLLTKTRIQALQNAQFRDDDQAILEAYEAYQAISEPDRVVDGKLLERVQLARQRLAILERLRVALAYGDHANAVTIYEPHAMMLRTCRAFTSVERAALRRALQRVQSQRLDSALRHNSPEEALAAATHVLHEGYHPTKAQKNRLLQVHERLTAIRAFQQALARGDDEAITQTFHPDLFNESLSPVTMERVRLARERLDRWLYLEGALNQDEDRVIALAYDRDLFETSSLLTPTQKARCELALARWEAYQALRQAMDRGAWGEAIAIYAPHLLEASTLLTETERQMLVLTAKRVALLRLLDEALTRNTLRRVGMLYKKVRAARIPITDPSKFKVLHRVRQVVAKVDLLRQEMMEHEPDLHSITWLGSTMLDEAPDELSDSEEHIIISFIRQYGALLRLKRAIAQGHPPRIVAVYQPSMKDAYYRRLSPLERETLLTALSSPVTG